MVAKKELLSRLKNLIKALEPISLKKVSDLLEIDRKKIMEVAKLLNNDYIILKKGKTVYLEYSKLKRKKNKSPKKKKITTKRELLSKLKSLIKGADIINLNQISNLLNVDKEKIMEVAKSLSDNYVILKKAKNIFLKYSKLKKKRKPKKKNVVKRKVVKKKKKEKQISTKTAKAVTAKDLIKKLFKRENKKPLSLGLGYEIKRLLGLVQTIDEKEAKLDELNIEKELLKNILKDFGTVEDKVVKNKKNFLKKVKHLEWHLTSLKKYKDKLSKLDKNMDKLSKDIEVKSKRVSDDIEELKKNTEWFKNLEDKIDKERVEIVDHLKNVKDDINKESKKKAVGYKAILMGPFSLPKLKQEKPNKKIVRKKAAKELDDTAEKLSKQVINEALAIKKEVKTEKKLDKNQKTKTEGKSKELMTEIDEVLELVKKKGKVSFPKLAAIYEEKIDTVEGWCEALEEQGFVDIVYPLLGAPYIRYIKPKEEEK